MSANSIITATTAAAQMMLMKMLLLDSTITEDEERSVRRSPNGKLRAVPITAATTEMARYFTRYWLRIFILPRPMAFITPISLNSDEMVKEMVNLRTMSDTIISIALTAKSSRATIISKR